uniref:NADH-ubiquinone oxidoreductase chain 1 n=1 Tax=Eucoleus annulatus TaxID=2831232 RepID=A0A8E8HW06_9BILA|nr:NADH dehydrogenase subunit 1 [Eucoleus annulatus]QWC93309.1 NADH dehydrogenase subunit 1 [Eucoleus annulatus]
MLMWILQSAIMLLAILLAVAFITLLERAYMGVVQCRRGPNKVLLWGIIQPVLDGMKLMVKTLNKPFYLNYLLFTFIPSINLLVFLLFWIGMPYLFSLFDFYLNSLFVMILLGMLGFGLLLSSWASNSKYALYGSLRSMVQSISYEICLSLIILMMLNLKDSFSFYVTWKGFLSLELLFSWMFYLPIIMMILAECGRTPFDFMEAESELVSGFNVEYGSVEFAFLFMAEYGMIITLSILFCVLLSSVMSNYLPIIIISSVLFTRYTFPRLRYDYLMSFMWKVLLPVTIMIWVMIFNVKIL